MTLSSAPGDGSASGADALTASTGSAIRAARESRALSTRALSRLSGVSQSTLSNIENGRVQPSLRTLYALAEGMGVGPGALLPTAPHPDERPHPPAFAVDAEGSPVTTTLLYASPDSVLEAYLIEQRAGYRDEEQYAHSGEDLIHVLSGRVTLVCGGSRLALDAGDTVWLDGGAPHSFTTPRSSGVVALIVTCRTPGS